MDDVILHGKAFIPGAARGEALVSREPLSFWGGYDWKTGEIIDRRHPLSGSIASGKILAIPFTRGSSTTTAVLLEAIRAGTAPKAILTTAVDFLRSPRSWRRNCTMLLSRWSQYRRPILPDCERGI
jgi:predicted aconitase with swiveling domain